MQIINSLIKVTKIGLLILLFGFYFKPCYFKIVIVFYETLFFAMCYVFIVFSKHYLWPNTKFNRVVGLISIIGQRLDINCFRPSHTTVRTVRYTAVQFYTVLSLRLSSYRQPFLLNLSLVAVVVIINVLAILA